MPQGQVPLTPSLWVSNHLGFPSRTTLGFRNSAISSRREAGIPCDTRHPPNPDYTQRRGVQTSRPTDSHRRDAHIHKEREAMQFSQRAPGRATPRSPGSGLL